MTRRGRLLFVALRIIWGLPYLLIRIAVRELSLELLVLIRTGGAALVLVPIAVTRGQLRVGLQRWRPILLYSVVELAVPWLLPFSAEQRLSSSVSGLLISTVPFFATMLAWMSRSEWVDGRRLVGLEVGIAGVTAIVGRDVGSSNLRCLCAVRYRVWVRARSMDPRASPQRRPAACSRSVVVRVLRHCVFAERCVQPAPSRHRHLDRRVHCYAHAGVHHWGVPDLSGTDHRDRRHGCHPRHLYQSRRRHTLGVIVLNEHLACN